MLLYSFFSILQRLSCCGFPPPNVSWPHLLPENLIPHFMNKLFSKSLFACWLFEIFKIFFNRNKAVNGEDISRPGQVIKTHWEQCHWVKDRASEFLPMYTSLQAQNLLCFLPAQRCMALLDFWDDPDSTWHKILDSTSLSITLSTKTTTLLSAIFSSLAGKTCRTVKSEGFNSQGENYFLSFSWLRICFWQWELHRYDNDILVDLS